MRGRVGLFLGFGAGYVLGSKAGRERYEQLSRLYENVLATPAFQRLSGKAKGAMGSSFDVARDKASEGVHKVTEAVKERRSDDTGPGLSVAPPPQ